MYKTIVVLDEKIVNYNLWKYLKLFKKHWSKLFIIKQLKNKKITVNGKKAKFNYKLQLNDVIDYLDLPDIHKIEPKTQTQNLQKLPPIDVVYEDEKIIIVNKEPGVVVQSTKTRWLDNMENRLLKHLNYDFETKNWKPKFIHRIDLDTCGLLIGAKNHISHSTLSDDLKNKTIKKWYKALVIGLFPEQEIIMNNWIIKKNNYVKISHVKTTNSKEAISKIKLLKHYQKTSLLEIELITGRKHQIRAQLNDFGYPICGDKKYNSFNSKINNNFPFTALCSYKLMFIGEHETISSMTKKNFQIKNIWFENKKYLI